MHQQALRIDKDVTLFAFDFLARIVPARVDATRGSQDFSG